MPSAAKRQLCADMIHWSFSCICRLRQELEETRERERMLDGELSAAQHLFAQLESEVVSLQQEQAQATAKLQVSQDELLSARAELVAAKQYLSGVQSPAAEHVSQVSSNVGLSRPGLACSVCSWEDAVGCTMVTLGQRSRQADRLEFFIPTRARGGA